MCPSPADYRRAYAGQADAAETEQLLQHADQCSTCMALVAHLQDGDSTLRQALHATPAEGTRTTMMPLLRPKHLSGLAELHFLAAPLEPDEIGRLAHYRILRLIGSGGMGLVVVAEDTLLRRQVALKLMRPNATALASGRERFLREARAMASLSSPNIVTCYAVGLADDVPYLAMELLAGQPLDELLRQVGSLSVERTVEIGRQIVQGLAVAHAQGLIHRDIKPANVFLTHTGEVKLLDFGLARPVDAPGLTESGLVVGTPGYMAPEQARGEPVAVPTDLFSLGCVLYRCLTGRDPFTGPTVLAILTALAVDEVPAVSRSVPTVPRALDRLIAELLAKRPERRPQSAEVVRARLQALAVSPHRRVPVRSWWQVAGVAAAVAAVLVLAVIVIRMRTPDGKETVLTLPEGSKVAITVEAQAPANSWDEWKKATLRLPGPARVDAVVAKLKELNTGYVPVPNYRLEESRVVALILPAKGLVDLRPLTVLTDLREFRCDGTLTEPGQIADVTPLAELPHLLHLFLGCHAKITDLTPLQKLPLSTLSIYHSGVTDLRPLRRIVTLRAIDLTGCRWPKPDGIEELPLLTLHISNCPQVRDLEFVRKMPLERLYMSNTLVRDLKPLAGQPLVELEAVNVPITDLSPLKGMPLTLLDLSNAPVNDLRPLAECPLTWLNLFGTQVRDLNPLRKMPLKLVNVLRTPATDFSPLHGLPLEELHGTFDDAKDGPWIRKLIKLRVLNDRPVER